MKMNRRTLLRRAAAIPLATLSDSFAEATDNRASSEKADYTLRIATGLVELSPEHVVSTTLYNGQFPGPMVRLTEGKRVVVDIYNDTDTAEQLHWHGQFVPTDVDGSAEEGNALHSRPRDAPHRLCAAAVGFPYHTHVVPMNNLSLGTYTGQAGPVYIEPAHNPGAYDREVFLVLKEFQPSFSQGGDMAMDFLVGAPIKELQDIGARADQQFKGPKGYEVGYDLFGINGKMLGHGEPIRVKQGERVLLHALNASAGEIRSLALPGHVFKIVALDGNPVPTPASVPVLWLGTAERISAIVEMNHPGVWVMGDLSDDDRGHGMGIVVEYANAKGKPQWSKPKPYKWDYTIFGKAGAAPASPDETFEVTVVKHNGALNGFNEWLLNGEAFSMETLRPAYTVHEGGRYRFKFRNASDDIHPLHLHRHRFELVRVGGKLTAGVTKDVVMLGGFQEVEFDFVADNPGPTLFHCHQQLHMDFGFMAMVNYA
jgi:FtsP/CotA-like multicopper oxidase with cupredoxin domain